MASGKRPYRDPTADAYGRAQGPRGGYIDGTGYGLYYEGVRIELTKADFKSVLTTLHLELVKEPGRSPRIRAKKKTSRGNGSPSVTSHN